MANDLQLFTNPTTVVSSDRRPDPEKLTFRVLNRVAEARYELAKQNLEDFLNCDSEYPLFRPRIERYIRHAQDLVAAIEAKRSFPGKYLLTTSKQQELNDRVREHYRELQIVLHKICEILTVLRAEDVRSTIWVLRALTKSVVIIVAVGLFLDLSNGLLLNILNVTDDKAGRAADWIFNLLNF